MQLVNGAYNAVNGWVVYKPMIGYECQDGEYVGVEWWGAAAEVIARKRNRALY